MKRSAIEISDRTLRPKSADDKASFEERLKACLKEAQLVVLHPTHRHWLGLADGRIR
jgi:hypothetical protein